MIRMHSNYQNIKNNADIDWDDYIIKLPDNIKTTALWEKEISDHFKIITRLYAKLDVLEIGCSNGRWLRYFRDISEIPIRLYGIDNNPVGFIKRDIEFIVGDALDLPYNDNRFDIVFTLGLIEHFPRGLRQRIIDEEIRVVKKGGIIFNHIPNTNILSMEMIRIKFVYDIMRHIHHYFFRPETIHKYMLSKGFKELFCGYIGTFKNYGFLSPNLVTADSYLSITQKVR
jgi:SAM-dependent methyltransferase